MRKDTTKAPDPSRFRYTIIENKFSINGNGIWLIGNTKKPKIRVKVNLWERLFG